MASKTKPRPSIEAEDHEDLLSVRFYVADAGGGNLERCEVLMFDINGNVVHHADHPLENYKTITTAQKKSLRNLLDAVRNETFELEGFK